MTYICSDVTSSAVVFLLLPSDRSWNAFWHLVKCDLQVTVFWCMHMANLRKHLVWHMTLPWPWGKNIQCAYNVKTQRVAEFNSESLRLPGEVNGRELIGDIRQENTVTTVQYTLTRCRCRCRYGSSVQSQTLQMTHSVRYLHWKMIISVYDSVF